MHSARLSDAAIALHEALTQAGIRYSITGGFAVNSVVGWYRQCKNVNCLAATYKDRIITLLHGRDGFVNIQTLKPSDDHATFLWSDNVNRSDSVMVEVWCESFHGAQYSMQNVRMITQAVYGERRGRVYVYLLDVFYLFKEMLRAAAYRNKQHDELDLQTLVNKYAGTIQAGVPSLNYEMIGLALRRHPELEAYFVGVGIDVRRAWNSARGVNPDNAVVLGSRQRGILG
ncbi:hypothetical protein EJ04DRAFT_427805 [Polyplosphaeria fusca]|uniref:Uncharacterized protein n=1 Tax=Polyplosphaeria fusca TaxID=682080 RepID=A0A9P4R6P3_9PLEO|nr:hypothetical protein EJ04DRAFT_427805 [Polyplosphaeria fusca]